MKRLVSLALSALLLPAAVFAADTYKVDPVHSCTIFRVGHAGIGIVYGQFKESAGQFTLDDADPTQSSFDIQVQAASVDSHVDKRDSHLKSPDFLNAKQYPTITFKSRSVKKVDDKHLDVTGDFTLHGVTNSITIPVELIGKGEFPKGTPRVGIEAVFEIKQSDYQMKGAAMGTSDAIKLMVSVEGTK